MLSPFPPGEPDPSLHSGRTRTARRLPGPMVRVGVMSLCLGGCCCSDVCKWDDGPAHSPQSPGASALQLSPAEVSTVPGGSFVLWLRALDPAGKDIPLPSVAVTWSHTASSSAVKLDPLVGGVAVSLPAGVALKPFVIRAEAAGADSADAKISVIAGAVHDWVQLPHTIGGAPKAVLLDAKGTTCLQDMLVGVAGDAGLGQNLLGDPLGDCGAPETAIFSVDYGMLFEAGQASAGQAVPPWTQGKDILERDPLPSVRTVPVHIRIRVKPGDQGAAEKESLTEVVQLASKIFREARTGIEFALDVDKNVGSIDTGPSAAPFGSADCGDPVVMTSLGVDLSSKKLYVVYVPKISGGDKGWACTRMPDQNAAVAVVAYAGRSPTTASHELGHLFGLDAPLPKNGHTGGFTEIHGFDHTNVMWVGENMDKTGARRHLSLGQAFRMNLDRHSWLVHQFNLSFQKSCQCNPYKAGECPVLFLDVVDRGTAPTNAPLCTSDPWGPQP
jgi:hypothetical protein